jgi:Domain of unknown function (DUF6602)
MQTLNKFQRIVRQRIETLVAEAKVAGEPEHNATAGFLREKYITRFLRDMTPSGVTLTSGTLFGLDDREVSPQIDLIATLPSAIPTLVLHDEISMVPAEAGLMAVEIKTKLEGKHLEQVAKQNKWLRDLRLVLLQDPPPQTSLVFPTAILALDSALSMERIVDWMQSAQDGILLNGNTVMCCIIGKFHLIRQDKVIRKVIDDNKSFLETMHFISDFWLALEGQQEERKRAANLRRKSTQPYPHPLEAYLKGMKPG